MRASHPPPSCKRHCVSRSRIHLDAGQVAEGRGLRAKANAQDGQVGRPLVCVHRCAFSLWVRGRSGQARTKRCDVVRCDLMRCNSGPATFPLYFDISSGPSTVQLKQSPRPGSSSNSCLRLPPASFVSNYCPVAYVASFPECFPRLLFSAPSSTPVCTHRTKKWMVQAKSGSRIRRWPSSHRHQRGKSPRHWVAYRGPLPAAGGLTQHQGRAHHGLELSTREKRCPALSLSGCHVRQTLAV